MKLLLKTENFNNRPNNFKHRRNQNQIGFTDHGNHNGTFWHISVKHKLTYRTSSPNRKKNFFLLSNSPSIGWLNKAYSEKGNIFQWAKVSRNVGLLGESVGLSKQGNPRAARMRLWKVEYWWRW